VRFFSAPGRVISASGLRGKVICIVFGVSVLLTIVSLIFLQTSFRSAIGDQMDQNAVTTIRNLTARSKEPILTDNIFKLYQLAYDTVEKNKDIIYVYYRDGDDNVVIHTFKEYFPSDLLAVEHEFGGEEYSLKKFRTEEGILRDTAAPVFSGPETDITVHVGFVDYSLQAAVSSATQQLITIAGSTFLAAGVLVYLFTTYTAIRPIRSLLESVRAVTRGNLSQRVSVSSNDELKVLADEFNIMTEKLSKTRQSRDGLIKKLISSQEEERKRIARELHDNTGQSLSTLMLSLHLLEKSSPEEEFKQKTEEFRSLLQQTIDQVRFVSWQLSPTPLDKLGLVDAVHSFVEKFEETAGWDINLHARGLDNVNLPPEVEINLYRVIQEALTNISRHARADRVDIFISKDGENLELIVDDDGVGFDPCSLNQKNGRNNTMGLNTMKERISLLGGSLDITSEAGKGTRIKVEIDLSRFGGDYN